MGRGVLHFFEVACILVGCPERGRPLLRTRPPLGTRGGGARGAGREGKEREEIGHTRRTRRDDRGSRPSDAFVVGEEGVSDAGAPPRKRKAVTMEASDGADAIDGEAYGRERGEAVARRRCCHCPVCASGAGVGKSCVARRGHGEHHRDIGRGPDAAGSELIALDSGELQDCEPQGEGRLEDPESGKTDEGTRAREAWNWGQRRIQSRHCFW